MTRQENQQVRDKLRPFFVLMLAVASMVLITACGGSGSGAGTAPGPVANPGPQLSDLTKQAQQWLDSIVSQDSTAGPVTADKDTVPPTANTVIFKHGQVQDGRVEFYANDDATFDSVKQFAESRGWKLAGRLRSDNSYIFDLNGKSSIGDAIEQAKQSALARMVGPIRLQKLDAISNDTYYNDGSGSERHLVSIRAPQAWELLKGNANQADVGVLDGGFSYFHKDVGFSSIANVQGDYVDKVSGPNQREVPDYCSSLGRYLSDAAAKICSDANHGMYVSGIIGAFRNNGEGIAGVGNFVRLHAFRTTDRASTKAGIEALAAKNVRVINMSLGSEFCTNTLFSGKTCDPLDDFEDTQIYEINWAYINVTKYPNVLFVQSSGNDGDANWIGTSTRVSANFNGYFAMGASRFASWGSGSFLADADTSGKVDRVRQQVLIVGGYSVDKATGTKAVLADTQLPPSDPNFPFILAPGESILSTRFDGTGSYGLDSGTSMAAPFVSGVAALVLQANPTLSATEVRNIILDFADGEDGEKFVWGKSTYRNGGYRYLNAERAVQAAIELLNKCGTASPPSVAGQAGPLYFSNVGDTLDFVSSAVPKIGNPYTSYVWKFSDTALPLTTNLPQASHVFTQGGSGSVSMTPYVGTTACQIVSSSVSITQVAPPVVTAVSPLITTLGTSTVFTVTGANLQAGMGFAIDDCSPSNNELPGGTASQRQFQCSFSGTAVRKNGVVKTTPGGSALWNFVVDVNSGQFFTQGGLTWMIPTLTATWSDANAYCNNTPINGQTGWRLPTIEELTAVSLGGVLKTRGWLTGDTWSATPYPYVAGSHQGIWPNDGSLVSHMDYLTLYVPCVHQ